MSRPIMWQVSGLALVSVVAALVIGFGIVLLTPTPVPERISAADAAALLRSAGPLPGSPMRRSLAEAPPQGRESTLVAAAIADLLRVDPSRVRVAWHEVEPSGADAASTATGESVLTIAGRDAVIVKDRDGFTMRWGEGATLSTHTPLPPFAAAVQLGDGRWLTVAPRDPWLPAWRVQMLAAFLLSALLLAPLAWLSARRITEPIRSLAEAAARMQLWKAGPVTLEGPPEVQAAAAAMNAMRERLASEASERTRMLAAVAHDLRNPLTGIRLRAESAPEPARAKMVADIERMEEMIAQVLDYAKGREIEAPGSPLDPAPIVELCAEEAVLRGGAVTIGRPLRRDLRVQADGDGLRRALANLVDNSLRYAGKAKLSLGDRGEMVAIIVDDSGPGIPQAEIPRLLEPFQRLEGSRSRATGGAGLGLAIADDLARRHGGELRLTNRARGGLRAEIVLPKAAPQDARGEGAGGAASAAVRSPREAEDQRGLGDPRQRQGPRRSLRQLQRRGGRAGF
jgi:signal transduction histidine kinase